MATLGKVATSSAAGTATDDERAAAAAVHKPTVAMGWFDRRRMKEQKKTFNKVAVSVLLVVLLACGGHSCSDCYRGGFLFLFGWLPVGHVQGISIQHR